MAAGPIGIDIGSTMGYVDLMKESPAWTPLTSSTLALDANGWPLADASVNVVNDLVDQSYNGPDPNAITPDIGGTYHLSFQGSATLGADYYNNFTVQNQVYNATTNTTTADLIVLHNTVALMTIDFRNTYNPASSTKAGVADVQLIQPGYAANTTQIFTNSMVADLKPFSTVRYLDADGANSYGVSYTPGYVTFSTPSFTVSSGTHTITFQGMNTVGDATAFIDTVQVVTDPTVQVVAGLGIRPNTTGGTTAPVAVGDPSFEADQIGSGNYVAQPTGTPWTYSISAGLAANGSAFTSSNPNAPDGQQVAFLQNQGAVSQTLSNVPAGSYHISFDAMQRIGYAAQTLEVLVDGSVVGTFTPTVPKLASVEWANRKLPTASSQVTGPGAPGEAWEYLVALANASNTDLWINIPGPASNDYITQLANLIKNGDTVGGVTYKGLNSNLKVYLEDSNEVWGGIYNPFIYNYTAAQASVAGGNTTLNNDGNPNGYVTAQRFYLEQTMNATNIFRSVFGNDPNYTKIRPVLGSQENSPGYFTSLFPWFDNTFGAPSQYFYGIGAATYDFATDYSSVNNLIQSLYANLPQQYATDVAYTSVANYYGLHNIAYEGGPVTSGATTAAGNQVSLAAARDPQMEALVQQLYDTWFAAGGDVAATYQGPLGVYGPYNQYAIVELAQVADPTESAKYRGFLDLSQAAPQTVTAGYSVVPTSATTLSVTSDSVGQSFTSPTAGQSNEWLLNVPTAGTYDLVLKTSSGTSGGKLTVSLGDQNTLGTYTVNGAGTFVLTKLALKAGLNTVGIATLSPFTVASLMVTPDAPVLNDPGFEADQLPATTSGYAYMPQGTPWTFTSSAGVSANNSGFTSGNPTAPQGNMVAFLQNQGSFSQTATTFIDGNYRISFNAAQRANFGTAQTFQVVVDGKVVAIFKPTSFSYLSLSTPTLALTAGSHTIQFQGLNASGDATAFIDGVTLAQVAATASFSDPGFEADQLNAGTAGYAYDPQVSPWTFTSSAGVSANNSGFTSGNPAAPQGNMVAFLQNQGAFSQSVSIYTAGNYAISFSAAQRGNFGTTQKFQVVVDGKVVGTFSPSGTSYQSLSTLSLALSAGSHTVVFQGLNASGDATAFIDNVMINSQ